jgi:hypothetical protein
VLAARDYHLGEMFTFSVLRRRHDLPASGPDSGRAANLLEPVEAEL